VATGAVNQRVLWGAAFSPDGKMLVTCDRGGMLRLWQPINGHLLQTIPMMKGQVSRSVAVSPNGKLIACSIDYGGEPDFLWVWNMEKAEWTHQQPVTNRLNCVAFTRDGQRIMAGNHDGHLHVWKVGENGALTDERRIAKIGARVCYAAFSADEKSIFAVTDAGDGHISQWDVETGEELWRGPSLEGGLFGVAVLGPDRIVTTGFDDCVRLWQRQEVRKSR
jgi:WD40 repeat protein